MKYLYLILAILLMATVSLAQDDNSLFDGMAEIASSGNPEAQYHLGMFYNNGIGTSKNIKKAKGTAKGTYLLYCFNAISLIGKGSCC